MVDTTIDCGNFGFWTINKKAIVESAVKNGKNGNSEKETKKEGLNE